MKLSSQASTARYGWIKHCWPGESRWVRLIERQAIALTFCGLMLGNTLLAPSPASAGSPRKTSSPDTWAGAVRTIAYSQDSTGRSIPPTPDSPDAEPAPAPLAEIPIDTINLQIGLPRDSTPTDYAAAQFARQGKVYELAGTSRPWYPTAKLWVAPGLYHAPLYFEDINLERYGLSWGCLQPAASTAHFVGDFVALPYRLVHDPPHRALYDLGHERPGNRVPYRCYRDPIDFTAGLGEAATIVGLVFLIP